MLLSFTSCSRSKKETSILNPDKPVTISIWHYYNGSIKETFDSLISQFNETIGMETGIVVESQTYGNVSQLETALMDSANKAIGSSPMPDIFAAYADNAYSLSQMTDLVPLDEYFTEEELSSYKKDFLEEGRFLDDKKSYILPVAKSTENLFVNKTDWDKFAARHGFTTEDLASWDGIYKVSKKYYEETGKTFFTIDSHANFMILFAKQFDTEIFPRDEENRASFNFTENLAKKIWDSFYDPHINGYYAKIGRYSTDDAKTGDIMALISSTAGAGYFPTEITSENQGIYSIKPLVLPFPYITKDRPYAVQQGAGMCISKSDDIHEYASSIFLKWFTDIDQNIDFAINSGYLPVKNQAFEENLLLDRLDEASSSNIAIKESLITTNQMFTNYSFYSTKPFSGSYEMRLLLGNDLFDKIKEDLTILEDRVSKGEDRNSVIAEMISQEEFDNWYKNILQKADAILK